MRFSRSDFKCRNTEPMINLRLSIRRRLVNKANRIKHRKDKLHLQG